MIDKEDTDEAELSKGEVVNGDYIYIGVEMDEYKDILTRMARDTLKGKFNVILRREDVIIAGQ